MNIKFGAVMSWTLCVRNTPQHRAIWACYLHILSFYLIGQTEYRINVVIHKAKLLFENTK